MKQLKHISWMAGTCGMALLMLGGCTDQQAHRQAFFPEKPGEGVYAAADIQAAAGARNDAMLRPLHFDGNKLNSLGQCKLDCMTRDAGESVLTVYLDLPKDATAQRKDAVVAYLHEKGLKDSQISLKQGVNPATLSPSEDGLTRLSKTENPSAADAQLIPGGGSNVGQMGIVSGQ